MLKEAFRVVGETEFELRIAGISPLIRSSERSCSFGALAFRSIAGWPTMALDFWDHINKIGVTGDWLKRPSICGAWESGDEFGAFFESASGGYRI